MVRMQLFSGQDHKRPEERVRRPSEAGQARASSAEFHQICGEGHPLCEAAATSNNNAQKQQPAKDAQQPKTGNSSAGNKQSQNSKAPKPGQPAKKGSTSAATEPVENASKPAAPKAPADKSAKQSTSTIKGTKNAEKSEKMVRMQLSRRTRPQAARRTRPSTIRSRPSKSQLSRIPPNLW